MEINTLGFFAKQFANDEGCTFEEALLCLAHGVIENNGCGMGYKKLASIKCIRHEDGSLEVK